MSTTELNNSGQGLGEAYRVLVIGGDHANTLAAIRALGLEGIAFDLIIHGGETGCKTMVEFSKFAPSPRCVEDSYDAICEAIRAWVGESEPSRCILLPSSDLAALVIDERFRPLGVKSSGFIGESGRVGELMDKYAQAQWAVAHGIPVAGSAEIAPSNSCPDCPVGFPAIIKPAVSAEGRKGDIRICRTSEDYNDAIGAFVGLGYERALVQELITYEHEIICIGLIRLDGTSVWRAYVKESVFPEGKGSTVRGHLETDPLILEAIDDVLKVLSADGYRGLFDIEFFKTPDKVILNEINFRQSGIVAFPFYEGLFLPSLWVGELCGCSKGDACDYPDEPYMVVVEANYLSWLREKGVSLVEWLRALKEPSGKALLFADDLGPLGYFVRSKLASKLQKLVGVHGRLPGSRKLR